jgi:hypothetical protein
LLLTRSKNLAQKLNINAKGLINAKLGITSGLVEPEETTVGTYDDSPEDTNGNFLALTDDDFPIVCTFNYFIRLMENAIRFGTMPCGIDVCFR